MSNAKQLSLIRQLSDSLKKREPSATVTEDQDKVLFVKGSEKCAIKCKAHDTQFKNSVGMPQEVFSPMVMQVIEEESTVTGISTLHVATKAHIEIELARIGSKQERFLNANGAAPALSQFQADNSVSGSTKVAEISCDFKWPLSGQ